MVMLLSGPTKTDGGRSASQNGLANARLLVQREQTTKTHSHLTSQLRGIWQISKRTFWKHAATNHHFFEDAMYIVST